MEQVFNFRSHKTPALLAAFIISSVLACVASAAAETDGSAASISRVEAVRSAIQNRLSDKHPLTHETGKERKALVEYYSDPDARLLWVDENGLSSRARSVIEEIERADDYGLRSSDYALPDRSEFDPNTVNATDWLANAEVKVSFAVLAYARDARGGRIEPLRISPNLDVRLILPNPLDVIESIALRPDPASFLQSFQPRHPQFDALRQKLSDLRGGEIVKAKDVFQIPQIPDGPPLRFGVEHVQVALLRRRLDLPPGPNENLYDAGVQQAVMAFQYEHGVYPDGIVGPATRRLLNPSEPRNPEDPLPAKTILVNMERWRWLPDDLGPFYVAVNVPEFILRLVAEGDSTFTTRVVVGDPDTQTPIFSGELEEIVFGPYWRVPSSIKTEEILPYIMRISGNSLFKRDSWDTSVFTSQNLRIRIGSRDVDPAKVDWSRIDRRKIDIYQRPGPNNALGKVKLVFPNKHNVYMHDTPRKLLFGNNLRAASHGCIRVQHPEKLALSVLHHDQGWKPDQVTAAIENGYDQHVTLKQKIPVHIMYFTLWADDHGSLSYFGDPYGHDRSMAKALGISASDY